jgi:CheY-like chemotaxis protein
MLPREPDVDLVQMDVMMPEMDGYEPTQEIPQDGARIIALAYHLADG